MQPRREAIVLLHREPGRENKQPGAVHAPSLLAPIGALLASNVFVAFSALYLGEPVKWNTLVGFGFIAIGAAFVFTGR